MQRATDLARRENLTVRQLAQRLGGYSGLAMAGTAKTIADEMEEWLFSEGSDGFTVMFPYLPGGLEDFVAHVIPELQRRACFGATLKGQRCANISACRARTTASFLIEFTCRGLNPLHRTHCRTEGDDFGSFFKGSDQPRPSPSIPAPH